ncbi:MAG: hypothetical protein Q4C54_09090 [Clostridia bacterium]|nr:hypothetical protein [Clostridia bacterium]
MVIRSDKGKGGTWAGATENLKKGWCSTFCRDCDIPGNRELIRMGAIPVSDEWDGNVELAAPVHAAKKEEVFTEQLSLFDM